MPALCQPQLLQQWSNLVESNILPGQIYTNHWYLEEAMVSEAYATLSIQGVEFEACHMDLTAGEQHQRWYLEMNPW